MLSKEALSYLSRYLLQEKKEVKREKKIFFLHVSQHSATQMN